MARSSILSRRELLVGGAALGALGPLGAACAGTAGTGLSSPPNILVIIADEHNAGLMGCAGDPMMQTPAMDRLAREGARLTRAYAASPVCAPSRQSMFTGLYPNEHGQWGNGAVFDARVPTLAPYFRAKGYHTAVIGKTHVNNPDATYGFDTWWGRSSPEWMAVSNRFSGYNKDRAQWADKEEFKAIPDHRLRGRPLTSPDSRDGATWLDLLGRFLKAPPKQPFLCYTSFISPHHPWDLPARFYEMYDPASLVMPADGSDDLNDSLVARDIFVMNRWNKLDEAQQRLCRARYMGAVSYADSLLGRALDLLDSLDLAKNTLVVYLSDHGDMAGQKGMWLKGIMFDGAARVPSLWRLPGQIPAGSVVDGLWSGVDLYPTLAGLAGVSKGLPAEVSGRDRSAMIRGKTGFGAEHAFSVLTPQPVGEWPGQLMVRSDRYKLVHYKPSKATDKEEYHELYDMEADPSETKNLARGLSFQRELRELMSAAREHLSKLHYCAYPAAHIEDAGQDDEGEEHDSG